MTTAERLEARGEQRGEQRGRALGMAHILLGLLRTKFAEVPEPTRQRVASAAPEDLERWSQRLLTAQTLDEVFAGQDR